MKLWYFPVAIVSLFLAYISVTHAQTKEEIDRELDNLSGVSAEVLAAPPLEKASDSSAAELPAVENPEPPK